MLRLLDPGFGQPALFGGQRLIAALRGFAGSPRIEELPIDFTAVAVDLMRQREVWLREGDLWDAIRASIAIPGLFTPHEVHGRELVDGGLLAPLPIAATRLSDAHRLIAVDRIAGAKMLDGVARDIEDARLDEHLASSYGIFSGPPKHWATILFSAKAARWVADERWHSQQEGRFLPDGRYELKVPYSNSRELLMDVLHYGSDAEIVEPPALREQARALLALAISNYDR